MKFQDEREMLNRKQIRQESYCIKSHAAKENQKLKIPVNLKNKYKKLQISQQTENLLNADKATYV